MGALYEHHGSFFWRTYSNVNVQNGATIIEDPLNPGKPLRDGKNLAVRSLARQPDGQPRFKQLLTATGKPIRLQQCAKLADADETYCWVSAEKTVGSLELNILAQQRQKQILAWESEAGSNDEVKPSGDMTVTSFYETVYLPWIEAEKEMSTVRSYKTYWGAYLGPHFNHSKTLSGYQSFMGVNLLEKLATEYSEATCNHARSLACGIFSYAVLKGYLKTNPWREVKMTSKGQDVEEGIAYEPKDVERIIEALDRVVGREEYSAKMAAMAINVCFYAGLRPSECAGLRWENLTEDRIRVKHAYVAGDFKKTKTGKERTVVMLPTLQHRMRIWAMTNDHPTTGWVFPNSRGENPINMATLSARTIAGTLKELGIDWAGFYACRRGFGTMMVLAGATLDEVADAMGNSPDVVFKHYFKDKESKLAAKGMTKLAAAFAAGAGIEQKSMLAVGPTEMPAGGAL